MNDLDQTLDVYVDNLLRHAFKCYAQSERSGGQTAETEFSPLPMGPLPPDPGVTTSGTGRPPTEESSEWGAIRDEYWRGSEEPPAGGWDEEPEPIPREWQEDAADDAGVSRFGEL